MPFLMHGDCFEKMRDIPDGSVDMVFCDLPYGVTKNRWDAVIPFEPLWEQLLRVGKKNCAFVFTATQPFATALINSQPKLFRYDLVWQKRPTGQLNCKWRPMNEHESILVFGQGRYNAQKTARSKPRRVGAKNGKGGESYGEQRREAERCLTHFEPTSINYFAQDNGGLHPTQKPVALLEWLIKTYSNPGDIVLDPTMGSATTGVACINTGRHFIGIEKDPDYFEVARKRIEATLTSAVE